MNNKWKLIYYEDKQGSLEVYQFIETLKGSNKAKIFSYKDFIVLTNFFNKNTKQVPEKEINKAKKCRKDFLLKYSEEKLRKEYNENI